ncbi:MAG: RNA polymerase sigma factor [Bacteroidales bacterium]|nr:RNA polymerase sigma factor [Bacteroidales bacterium]
MHSQEFKNLVLPMGKKLFHFARLLLKDENEAQDAVQEVYIKLWNMRENFKTINNIEAFAMRMTRNWCLDRIKAKKPKLIENYSSGYDRQADTANPEKITVMNDRMNFLRRVMEDLPEPQKTIIQLRDIEGYEFEEIADITAMKVNAIRVALSRARNKIKETLLKVEDYGYQQRANSAG